MHTKLVDPLSLPTGVKNAFTTRVEEFILSYEKEGYDFDTVLDFMYMAMSYRLVEYICNKAESHPSMVVMETKYKEALPKGLVPLDEKGYPVDKVLASDIMGLCITSPETAKNITLKCMKDTTREMFYKDMAHDLDIITKALSTSKNSQIMFTLKPSCGIWSDARMNTCRNIFYLYVKAEVVAIMQSMGNIQITLCSFMAEWQSLTPWGVTMPPTVMQQITTIIQTSNTGGEVMKAIVTTIMEAK